MKPLSLLVADDHEIVRSGIKSLLEETISFERIEEAATGDEVIQAVKEKDFDLIILDINMPDTDAFTLVRNILVYKRNSKLLIFSMNDSSIYAKRFMRMGALGYLHKESGLHELRQAALTVLKGYVYRSAEPKKQESGGATAEKENNPFEKLSDRELQVANCLLMGYSYGQMKEMLHLHSSTIATHRTRMYEKLGIDNLCGLAELARQYDFDGRLNYSS